MKCAIGIDAGGTKLAGGLVLEESGEARAVKIIPTLPQRGGEAVLNDALGLARDLQKEARAMALDVQGIGVGVAEIVDLQGNIQSGHTISWQGVPVRERFSQLAPTIVEADVRAAALGEAMYGAGRGIHIFLYVTVGTGISTCLVQDGRAYPGARGSAGTLATGHTSLHCPGCGQVSRLVLEEFAAGPALAARYRKNRPAAEAATAEDVIRAAEAREPVATAIVRSAGEALGSAIGLLVNVLDPEAVIVGGGLGLSGGLYWESLVASTRAHIWSYTHRELPILPAALGTAAGLIGAGAAVFQGLPKP